ncbi:MAG: cytochrome c maturation protein CcmE [Pseudomonadota bacterium]
MSTTKKAFSPFRRRQRRLLLLGIILPAFAGATTLAMIAVGKTEVYFYGPSGLPAYEQLTERDIRIGGLVAKGTLMKGTQTAVQFTITDGLAEVQVLFDDALPGLVVEGDGVVAQGRLRADGTFIATSVLARHDENYMAPEVAQALKESGQYEEYIKKRRQ